MTAASDHQPLPHQFTVSHPAGVACTCGEDFVVGMFQPWTRTGKPSKRQLKTMKHCWEAHRQHWSVATSMAGEAGSLS